MLLPQIPNMFFHNKTRANRASSKSKIKILPLVSKWTKGNFRHLGIGQKIGFGYGVAIGIAVTGTASGLVVGELLRQGTAHQQEVAHQQQLLLHNLQNAGLESRSHALRLPATLGNSAAVEYEYKSFLEKTNRTKKLLSELESFIEANREVLAREAEKLEKLSQRYAILVEYYAVITQRRLEEINPGNLKPKEIESAQLKLLRISSGEESILIDELAEDLNKQILAAYQRELEAKKTLKNAENLRLAIIIGSILISAAIAASLAVYTSRAIARPIIEVAEVANRVATEHNFLLRAPVTTENEVGLLADSLNHLIERVAEYTQELKQTQNQLIQTEKMSGIGQMAAGVAHEINNPINFIHGNIEYANSYVRDLLELISLYQQQYPNPSVNIQEYIEEIDLDFLTKDLPKTLSSLQIGSDKIREIVVSMRNFSRLDECSIAAVDIKKGIDSTLIILNHRLKSGIKLIKEYGNVPPIRCYPAQLNQVFMNIISNAIDAIEETQNSASWNSEEIPTIWIITEVDGDYLKVRIKDNGPGIAPEIREKIFESFFTTKSVGKGTGLGLAISYQIVAKHNGTIEVNSEPGKGTEFAIALPVESV
jgi:signal transduction histidine kinase